MLDVLRRIIQEVDRASDLGDALHLIVERIQAALKVDVCSIYLAIPEQQQLILMATYGLEKQSELNVRMKMSEGLVGLVAERSEPINLADAQSHPRYLYFEQTGEEQFHSFLGVPIVRHRKLLGVLVVQGHVARRFDDDHEAFMVTLAAQLAGAISHAEVSGGITRVKDDQLHDDLFLSGVSGSSGVAIGTALVAYGQADLDTVPDRWVMDIKFEEQQFRQAVATVQETLRDQHDRLKAVLPDNELLLFDAYIMMLGSDKILHYTVDQIRTGLWAQSALRRCIQENIRVFQEMDDPYLRERAEDVRDLGQRVLQQLQQDGITAPVIDHPVILVGHELTAGMLAEVPPEYLKGVVSSKGSSSSHVAILARAMGVPTVMGVEDLPVDRIEGTELIVDGYIGWVYVQPSESIRNEFMQLIREEDELSQSLAELRDLPAITPDGHEVPLFVNSGLLTDLDPAQDSNAAGIGLYRTEMPFMIRDRFPGEDEQYLLYRQILESFAPRPVTLRTLDIGGDKALPYFPVTEENPFLGWRGIRISLDHPEIFLTQVRAMLRANAGLDNLQILLPMVSSLSELSEAQVMINNAYDEIHDEGVHVVRPKVGVMIEVPSAVYLARSFANRVDFLSVGTNDLVQYLLAVDRNNARVADLYHHQHPAVIHALAQVVGAARAEHKPVSICGEMASDPASVVLLLGMGVDYLSLSVSAVQRVKWIIRNIPMSEAQEIFEQSLSMEEPDAIRRMLEQTIEKYDMGGLLHAGKH